MDDIRTLLRRLQSKGWTLAAVADAIQVPINTVTRWKMGIKTPANPGLVSAGLRRLLARKRVPPQRRRNPGPYSQQRRKEKAHE
jgi:hypothetical protein